VSKVRSALVVVAALTAVHMNGCSLSSMTTLPDDYHPRQTPQCSGYIYPILDAFLTPMFSVITLSLATNTSDEESQKGFEPDIFRIGTIVIFGLATVVSLFSGTCGFLEANRCHRAHDSHQAWLEMKDAQQVSEEADPDDTIGEE
jgi:hypothetical protein